MKNFIATGIVLFGLLFSTQASAGSFATFASSNVKGIVFLVAAFIAISFVVRHLWMTHKQQKQLMKMAMAEQEAFNESLLRNMLASSLPPPRPSFVPDPANPSLMRYVPLESTSDLDKTPVQTISPMAESERETIPTIVSKTVSNIPVVNFDDEPTQPNLQMEELARLSVHPKSNIKLN